MSPGSSFPAEFEIGGRPVGAGHPCYVIAEAGANHNRDLEVAKRLIDVAAEAGADAVKFQTYSGERIYSSKTPKFEYLAPITDKPPAELLEEISLPREWQRELAEHASSRGIQWFSSPFDLEAVAELDALDVPARVVLLSGTSEIGPELRGRVADVIGKPFDLQRLSAAVSGAALR